MYKQSILFLMLVMSIFFTTLTQAQTNDSPFPNNSVNRDWNVPFECHEHVAPPYNPGRVVFDEACTHYWHPHSNKNNVAHITVGDTVEGQERGMRIDIFQAEGGSIIVRRFCRWDRRGGGYRTPVFDLRLRVREGNAEFRNCDNKKLELPRKQAILAILNKVEGARNRPPPIVRLYLNRLKREVR